MKHYKISDMVVSRLVNPRTGKEAKEILEEHFDCSTQSVNSWIRCNYIDGPLTREAALKIIEKCFNLSRNQVLIEVDALI